MLARYIYIYILCVCVYIYIYNVHIYAFRYTHAYTYLTKNGHASTQMHMQSYMYTDTRWAPRTLENMFCMHTYLHCLCVCMYMRTHT